MFIKVFFLNKIQILGFKLNQSTVIIGPCKMNQEISSSSSRALEQLAMHQFTLSCHCCCSLSQWLGRKACLVPIKTAELWPPHCVVPSFIHLMFAACCRAINCASSKRGLSKPFKRAVNLTQTKFRKISSFLLKVGVKNNYDQ